MSRYEHATLWTSTLAPRPAADLYAAERDRLRQAFERFRDRAGTLAGEIPQDLRDFTVHDRSHIDALWEMASLVAGPAFRLTPAEAFVLGGAFLVHDLGLSLAAYAGGMQEVREHPLWRDTLASRAREDRSAGGGASRTPEHERWATAATLRQLHAERAEGLALTEWADGSGGRHTLLEDGDLRRTYGRVIGLIAHSHWWGVDQLTERLPQPLGAPGFLPNEWTVDPVKLAALLRCADAAHLDDRRAPAFLRAVRRPAVDSDAHWVFQERLNQPRLEEGRLVYTAKRPFPPEDAPAWWLCYDTLRGVDRELAHVDGLLADTRRLRLEARAVANVEDPRRLAGLIPTDRWEPVDARVRVGAVMELVAALGGRELYGTDPVVPLRELIQNGADAVRARRLLESFSSSWGEVSVTLRADGDAWWVEVSDNGVGMSLAVLSGPFLDFGASLWRTDGMHREFPGLAAKGFEPTGKFGIGFFSVFMWGGTIQVLTRRYEAARSDTWVLEFTRGLSGRPLLRRAHEAERLREGGTTVRVRLEDSSPVRDLIEGRFPGHGTFERACARLCATADVNVRVQRGDAPPVIVVQADDWLTMDGVALLERIMQVPRRGEWQRQENARRGVRLRVLRDDAGRAIGRACLVGPGDAVNGAPGAVCVGGFVADAMHGIAGVLLGSPTTATRQAAIPFLRGDALAAFVAEQIRDVAAAAENSRTLVEIAKLAWHLGGDLGELPVARTSLGLMTTSQLTAWFAARDAVVVASEGPFQLAGDLPFQLPSGVPLQQVVTELQAEVVLDDGVVLAFRGGVRLMSTSLGLTDAEDEWLRIPHQRPSARMHDPLLAHLLECGARGWRLASADPLVPQLSDIDNIDANIRVGTVRGVTLMARGCRLVRPSNADNAS